MKLKVNLKIKMNNICLVHWLMKNTIINKITKVAWNEIRESKEIDGLHVRIMIMNTWYHTIETHPSFLGFLELKNCILNSISLNELNVTNNSSISYWERSFGDVFHRFESEDMYVFDWSKLSISFNRSTNSRSSSLRQNLHKIHWVKTQKQKECWLISIKLFECYQVLLIML
jgi:hypothetical protein